MTTYDDIQGGQEILCCLKCHKVLRRGATVGKKFSDKTRNVECVEGYSKVTDSAGYVDNLHIAEGDLKRISVPPPSKCPSRRVKYQSFHGGEQEVAAHCAVIAGLREDEQAMPVVQVPPIFRSTIAPTPI